MEETYVACLTDTGQEFFVSCVPKDTLPFLMEIAKDLGYKVMNTYEAPFEQAFRKFDQWEKEYINNGVVQ